MKPDKEKYVVIIGAAESGVGAAMLAKKLGIKVFVTDARNIKEVFKNTLIEYEIDFEEGKHTEEKILNADEVIKSPGVPHKIEIIKKCKEQNIPIISEIEFAARYTKAKIIAITGTNGKTTTTLLTYHLFKKAGKDVLLAGNVGDSFAKMVALSDHDPEYFVLEVSSFQLDDIENFKPYISILLNITPDHLDRYEYKFENYIQAKFNITKNQQAYEYFIYNADDTVIAHYMEKHSISATCVPISVYQPLSQGAYLNNSFICLTFPKTNFTMSIHELALQGKHNYYNSMAAAVAARIEDLRKNSIRESLADFKNEAHRMEFVASIQGVEYINDSKATNINSVWYALESMTKPVIWVVGGQDKGNDYSELIELVKEKVKAIICLGADNTKIHNAFRYVVEDRFDAKSAYEAVNIASKIAQKGDVVLLSPACASFDLFEDYKDRGNQFKEAVKSL